MQIKRARDSLNSVLALFLWDSEMVHNFRGQRQFDADVPQAFELSLIAAMFILASALAFIPEPGDKVSLWILLPLIPGGYLMLHAISMRFMKGWPEEKTLRFWLRRQWRRMNAFAKKILSKRFWVKPIKALAYNMAKIAIATFAGYIFIGLASRAAAIKDTGILFAVGLTGSLLTLSLLKRTCFYKSRP